MAFLSKSFQEALRNMPILGIKSRKLQYEADISRLFLFTSYNFLGKDAADADIEEIIEMTSLASVSDQKKVVQENIHSQMKSIGLSMDKIFLPTENLSSSPTYDPVIPATRPLKQVEASQKLRDLIGYTLDVRPSQIPHEEAGKGLFLNGEADVGSVLAIYPGVIYSPTYHPYIPGYLGDDVNNPYLTMRHDNVVINSQPWGLGGETRGVWEALNSPENIDGSDGKRKFLSKLIKEKQVIREVIERRNPLALAHYANHPPKGTLPNVMKYSYDFPLTEKDIRAYIPNVVFGSVEEPNIKKLGSFWSKHSSSKNYQSDVPVLKTLVLVATKRLCDEELLLNYGLSNSQHFPEWYTPVNEGIGRTKRS